MRALRVLWPLGCAVSRLRTWPVSLGRPRLAVSAPGSHLPSTRATHTHRHTHTDTDTHARALSFSHTQRVMLCVKSPARHSEAGASLCRARIAPALQQHFERSAAVQKTVDNVCTSLEGRVVRSAEATVAQVASQAEVTRAIERRCNEAIEARIGKVYAVGAVVWAASAIGGCWFWSYWSDRTRRSR